MTRIKFDSIFLFILYSTPFVPLIIMFGLGSINTTIIALVPIILTMFLIAVLMIKVIDDGVIHVGQISVLDMLVGIYMIIGIIQTLNPNLPHLGYAIRGFYEHLFWVLFYFITRYIYANDIEKTYKIINAICTISLLSSIFGVLLLIIGIDFLLPEWTEYRIGEESLDAGLLKNRSIGTLGSPFAFGLLCSFGLGAILSLKKIASLNRILYYGAITILLCGIFVASSRSVILGTLFALTYYHVTSKIRFRIVTPKSLLITMSFSVFLFIIYEYSSNYLTESILFDRISSLMVMHEEANVDARFYIWGKIIPDILNNPLGYGTGALGAATYLYGDVLSHGIADNNYLEIFAEQGILGLIIFLLIIIVSFTYGRRIKSNLNTIKPFSVYIIIVACISSIGAPVLKAYVSNLVLWSVLGTLSASYVYEQTQKKDSL